MRGTWTNTQGPVQPEETLTDNSQFGIAVALSGDAKTLFVGARNWRNSDGDKEGGVWVYKLSSTREYEQVGDVLEYGGYEHGAQGEFGLSLATTSNGKTLVVGAENFPNYDDDDFGAALIFFAAHSQQVRE